jgi:hypothetical protein
MASPSFSIQVSSSSISCAASVSRNLHCSTILVREYFFVLGKDSVFNSLGFFFSSRLWTIQSLMLSVKMAVVICL